MSRYDGLIIPRSYNEYINKTDAATLQQALQLSGVLSGAVAAGDNKAVTSNAVNDALANYINKTDATTLQQALQLSGVLSDTVAAGDNKAVTSNAVNSALWNYQKIETYTVTTNGGTVSIDLRGSPSLYFVCWGYDTYENSAFIQYNYDWRGARAKIIILKRESTYVTVPKVEIKDNKLVITHQYGDGTCMQVCGLG